MQGTMLPPVIYGRNKSSTVVSVSVMTREASEGQTLFDNLRRLSESRDAESSHIWEDRKLTETCSQ